MRKANAMKRTVAAVLVICTVFCMLTACGTTLSGTYTKKDSLIKEQFTFKDDGKVAVSAFGIDVEGDYVIEDGTITITYSLLDFSYDWTKSFEKDGDSIFIDGEEFVKE